jgi:pSer/pThr/pTyr-binding forkhead associated (FHA) protein
MAKLVVLTEGLKDRSHELTAERTTIGRVEDNTFQIMEASVSSHHCEILVRGTEVRVKDLNSTNGSFIDGQQITEAPLKPGQLLRLGKIELRLEGDAAAGAPKKPTDQTMVMQKGVSLNELEKGPKSVGFDTAGKGFAKKTNKTNLLFIIIVVVVMLAILGVLMKVIFFSGNTPPGH